MGWKDRIPKKLHHDEQKARKEDNKIARVGIRDLHDLPAEAWRLIWRER